jgi:hypothetical protein
VAVLKEDVQNEQSQHQLHLNASEKLFILLNNQQIKTWFQTSYRTQQSKINVMYVSLFDTLTGS